MSSKFRKYIFSVLIVFLLLIVVLSSAGCNMNTSGSGIIKENKTYSSHDDNSYPLYDKNGVKLFLSPTIDSYSGEYKTYIIMSVTPGEDFAVDFENILVNDSIELDIPILDDYILVDSKTGKGKTELSNLNLIADDIGWENIKNISMDIKIRYKESLSNMTSISDVIDVSFDDGLTPCFTYFPYYGALADEQVLCDNEEIKLTLLYFGVPNANFSSSSASVSVLAENKTEEYKEVNVTGLIANGYFVPSIVPIFFDMTDIYLNPSEKRSLSATFDSDIFSLCGGIDELSLCILTDNSQRLNLTGFGGGKYNVELSESGKFKGFGLEESEIISAKEYKISDVTESYVDNFKYKNQYLSVLMFYNNMDENMAIELFEVDDNGTPIQSQLLLYDDSVVANSKTILKIKGPDDDTENHKIYLQISTKTGIFSTETFTI